MMKRRAFLGAMAAAPVAVPTMAGQMAQESTGIGYAGAMNGFKDAVPAVDPHWHARQVEQTRRALLDIDNAPDDVFGGKFHGFGDASVDGLKSVSVSIKRKMLNDIELRRSRDRAKLRLQQRLDDLMGNPLSKWDELMRLL